MRSFELLVFAFALAFACVICSQQVPAASNATVILPQNGSSPEVLTTPVPPINSSVTNETTTTVGPANTTIAPTPTPTQPTTVKPTPTTKPPVPEPVTTPTPAPTVPTTNATTLPPVTTALPFQAPTTVIPDRSFDGLSFIGGMVLTVGLCAIGLVAFKFYRGREGGPSYLTL